MATYLYRCDCLGGEVEVTQPMSEDAFVNCLQIRDRLGLEVPAACREKDGCAVTRLIAGASGVVVKGARPSCSIGEKASSCGCACASAGHGAPRCPFG